MERDAMQFFFSSFIKVNIAVAGVISRSVTAYTHFHNIISPFWCSDLYVENNIKKSKNLTLATFSRYL